MLLLHMLPLNRLALHSQLHERRTLHLLLRRRPLHLLLDGQRLDRLLEVLVWRLRPRRLGRWLLYVGMNWMQSGREGEHARSSGHRIKRDLPMNVAGPQQIWDRGTGRGLAPSGPICWASVRRDRHQREPLGGPLGRLCGELWEAGGIPASAE